jgi:fructose-specific phosphotransferase system component IIB
MLLDGWRNYTCMISGIGHILSESRGTQQVEAALVTAQVEKSEGIIVSMSDNSKSEHRVHGAKVVRGKVPLYAVRSSPWWMRLQHPNL